MPTINVFLISLGLVFILLLPVILAIALRRFWSVPWSYFCVGLLTFLGAQIIHLPLNWFLEKAGLLPDLAKPGANILIAALVLGFTAGLTEEISRTVGFAVIKKARHYQDGIMMGLGHGGIEVMVLGVMIAAGVASIKILMDVGKLPSNLSPEQADAIQGQINLLAGAPIFATAPIFERLVALLAQVSFSIIVLQAFVRKNALYVVAAILAHTLLDTVAVYTGIQFDNIWLTMAIIFVMALLLAFWAWSFRTKDFIKTRKRGISLSQEFTLFRTALRKELKYQWRSRRAFIVCVVFLLLGMGSPLIAKFTPELLKNLEETRQFANLIPSATVGEAVNQYIKNLTQFGVILVILLGMGAIAGEKEKGTAAMILSKPMPRWSFVISKYIAQSMIYVIAVLFAGAAAYYYTAVLFPGIEPGDFAIANGLLLIWLLVIAAVTLTGSALGKTIPAAAGFALVGIVLILVAGTIPNYGALAPGSLLSWANLAALGEQGAANIGSLVASCVLIILAIIVALAAFEKAEL